MSEKHANFILADENCKSKDIYSLIRSVKKIVFEKSGVKLKEELVYIGRFEDEYYF